jgi:protein involved in polysaccharide export with SLBB domain
MNPALRRPEVVFISGEVANPGPYVLVGPEEKLTDVIRRAGSLTRFADRNGLLFLRRRNNLEKPQQELDSDLILLKARLFADKQFLVQLGKSGITVPEGVVQSGIKSTEAVAKPAQVTGSGLTTANTKGPDVVKNTEADVEGNTALSEPIRSRWLYGANIGRDYVPSGVVDSVPRGMDDTLFQEEGVTRISVNLISALDDPMAPDNLPLRDGDRIGIPKVTNVVTVIGAVLHPHSFAAGGGKNAGYYIQRSGGFSPEASKGDVVVVRTNGDAMPMRSVKSVMPGDIIVVPTTGLIDITKKWEKVGNVTKVVSDILSSVFVLTRI